MECTYPKEFREGSFRERKFYRIAKDGIRLEKQGKAQVSPGFCNLKYSDNVLKKQNKTKNKNTLSLQNKMVSLFPFNKLEDFRAKRVEKCPYFFLLQQE